MATLKRVLKIRYIKFGRDMGLSGHLFAVLLVLKGMWDPRLLLFRNVDFITGKKARLVIFRPRIPCREVSGRGRI
jgi:hypothetical protein